MTAAAAAAVGIWAVACLLKVAVQGFVASPGQPYLEFTEPASLYTAVGSCQYIYDALTKEALKFNVTVTCGSQACISVLVRRGEDRPHISGCLQWCNKTLSSCSLGCTAYRELNVSKRGTYQLEVETSDSSTVKRKFAICVNITESPSVQFSRYQTTSFTSSENGIVELSLSADGYPKPISYELRCDQRVPQLSRTGNITLTNLSVGAMNCTAVAYSSRRLVASTPLPVLIKVIKHWPSTASSDGNHGNPDAPLSSSETRALTVQPRVSGLQEGGGGEKNLIIATVTPCVILVAISVFLVACSILRRRAMHSSARNGDSDSPVSQNTAPVAPIINNSTTTYNYFGNYYEILGASSSIVVQGGGGRSGGCDEPREPTAVNIDRIGMPLHDESGNE